MTGVGWDGTISGVQFKVAAGQLVKKWKELCPNSLQLWHWQDAPPSLGASHSDTVAGYLVLENVPVQCSLFTEKVSECDGVAAASYGDGATLIDESFNEQHMYTFHVVYSESYRVPVIYFRGNLPDGSYLLWDQILHDLPANMHDVDERSRWTFVTQQEHPYLRRPWFSLHPCGTAEMIALVFSDLKEELSLPVSGKNVLHREDLGNNTRHGAASSSKLNFDDFQYLLTWLSFVASVVCLNIPLSFFTKAE